MNATVLTQNRHTRRRAAALAKLGHLGPFLQGHLGSFKRPGCTQPGWHLTRKQQGKTRTVYVPMDLVAEVKLWTQNYRRLQQLMRQVTQHSLAIIRHHVAGRRAAHRCWGSTKRNAPKG
jgi:hypothetical protein